jgi:hypothetical protein
MFRQRSHLIASIVIAILICAASALAQEADNSKTVFPSRTENDQPKTVKEMMQKMRIEQDKKEYEEMLDRGEQALKISEELERAFSQRPELTRSDLEKLDDLEKLVKKIRGGLGGDDDDKAEAEEDQRPKSIADGFKTLQSLTLRLVDELKKTSRFGISAVAIQSSNAVLKVVRFLRLTK